MKTKKITWERLIFPVNYKSMRIFLYILLVFSYLQPAIPAYAKKNNWLLAQSNSFLVKPTRSKKARPMEKLKAKAMEKAALRHIARSLSAKHMGKDSSKHIFKVKLIKKGRVFFDMVKVK